MDELERRCKVQQDQLFQVKQDLTSTTAELKLQAVEAEGEWRSGNSLWTPATGIIVPESTAQAAKEKGLAGCEKLQIQLSGRNARVVIYLLLICRTSGNGEKKI